MYSKTNMPTVDGKHFAYTKAGKKAAQRARKRITTSDGMMTRKKYG